MSRQNSFFKKYCNWNLLNPILNIQTKILQRKIDI